MLKWSLLVLLLISAAGSIAFSNLIETEDWVGVSVKLQILRAVIFGVTALFAGFTFYVWLDRADRVMGWLQALLFALSRLRWGLLVPMVALVVAFPILVIGRLGVFLAYTWIQHAVFAWLVVLLAVCIMAFWQKPWIDSLFFSALSMAVVYHLGTYFPSVSNYPFSLGWSEASDYYLASTFFASISTSL